MKLKPKPCACGKIPNQVLFHSEIDKWHLVCGDCCRSWFYPAEIGTETDPDKIRKLHIEAWNAAPRPVLPSMSAIVDKSFVLEQLTQAKKFLSDHIDTREHDIQEELSIEEMIRAIDAILNKIDEEIPKLEV